MKSNQTSAPLLASSLCIFLSAALVQANFRFGVYESGFAVELYKIAAPLLAYGKAWIFVALLAALAAALGAIRTATAIVCVLGFFLNAYLFADGFVYALYRFHLDGTILPQLLGPDMGKDVFFSTTFLIKVAAYLLAFVGIHLAIYWVAASFWTRIGTRMTVAAVLSWVVLGAWAQIAYAHAFANYNPRFQAMTDALPLFRPDPLLDVLDWFGYHPVTRESAVEALASSNPTSFGRNYPLSPLSCAGPARAQNGRPLSFLVILVDTLRFDTATDAVMPNLSQAARKYGAWRFNNHLSGGNSTRPGAFSLFYGLPQFYLNAAIAERRPPVTMDQFEGNGYRFGIYVSSSLVRPPLDRTVFARLSDIKLQAEGKYPWQRDIAATDDFVSFAQQDDARPFYSFLFYDALHASSVEPGSRIEFKPFLEEVDYSALDPDYDPVPYFNRYRQTALQVDGQIGRVFEALETSGRLNDTVVVVTADHGEEFNDNGQNFWGHGSNMSSAQIHVPFYVFWPGNPGGDVSRRTSHYDLTPTLMQDFFGCPQSPSDYSLGRNIFVESPDAPPVPVASKGNYGMVMGDQVTVFQRFGQPRVIDLWTNRPLDGVSPPTGFPQMLTEFRTRFAVEPDAADIELTRQ